MRVKCVRTDGGLEHKLVNVLYSAALAGELMLILDPVHTQLGSTCDHHQAPGKLQTSGPAHTADLTGLSGVTEEDTEMCVCDQRAVPAAQMGTVHHEEVQRQSPTFTNAFEVQRP